MLSILYRAALPLLAAALTLGGCGGSSSDSDKTATGPDDTVTPTPVNGIAAVGAPITSGTVTAHCSDGSSFTQAVTTDVDGSWQGTVNSDALPCMLQVTGGNPSVTLHGYAGTGGHTNITPLTELVLALAAGTAPSAFFDTPGSWPSNSAINSASSDLLSDLTDAGYTVPSGLDPFLTSFTPQPGDGYDDLLETIQDAIDDDGNLGNLFQLRDSLVSGGNLPAPPGNNNLTPDGDGAALSGQDGATGTIDGTSHTYTSLVDWTILPGDGTGLFQARAGEDLPDSLTYWEISGVDPVAGSHDCGDGGDPPNLKLIQNGTNYLASDCVIEIISAGTLAVEGRFAATFDSLGTVTDGYFVLTDNSGGGGDPGGGSSGDNPALEDLNGRNGIIINVNNHDYVIADARGEKGAPTNDHRLFAFGDEWALLDDTTPFNGQPDLYLHYVELALEAVAGGTQSCDSNTSLTLSVNGTGDSAWKGPFTTTSCDIDITYISARGGVEGVITSAVLENGDGNQVTLSDAPFRVYGHSGTAGSSSSLPADQFASLNVGSPGTFELGENQYFIAGNGLDLGTADESYGLSPDDGTQPFDGNASDRIVLHPINLPSLVQGQTYDCGIDHPGGGSGLLNMELLMGVYQAENIFRSNNGAGDCSITVDSAYGPPRYFFDASYTATLVSSDDLLVEADRTMYLSGKFRNYAIRQIRAEGGDEGPLGATEHGVTMTVSDGSGHFTAGDRFKDLFEGFDTIGASATDFKLSTGIFTLDNLPLTVGTYNCPNDGGAGAVTMRVNTGFNIQYLTTTYDSDTSSYVLFDGASCQVDITAVNADSVEGNFSGTLVAGYAGDIMPSDNTISVSGTFRRAIATP